MNGLQHRAMFVDFQILEVLDQHPGKSIRFIAKQTGISKSTVHVAVQDLRGNNYLNAKNQITKKGAIWLPQLEAQLRRCLDG